MQPSSCPPLSPTSQGVTKFVLVTSIGCDDPLFPLNALWGVLFWKKQGEQALQRSGLDYTIVRPGERGLLLQWARCTLPAAPLSAGLDGCWLCRLTRPHTHNPAPHPLTTAGGLLNSPRAGQTVGNVVMGGPDTYGLPPRQMPGSILRTQVAECCIAALVEPAASGKVAEIVAKSDAPALGYTQLFGSV